MCSLYERKIEESMYGKHLIQSQCSEGGEILKQLW